MMLFRNQGTEERRAIFIVGALLLVGVAVRLYGVWCFRHNLNLDAGVVALMARHIALGKAYPVFFYGQAHMGTFEVMLGGLACRLFGISGFAVGLGTLFASFWLMPLVYVWARDAAGRLAGYVALAFVVIGPGGFFHYSASPRCAYATGLTLSAFILWYATRMAIQWDRKQRQRGLDFFLLGIGAGLAWWNSQLTTAAILSAALILLLSFRLSILSWRLLPGLAGFFAGSTPFWIYNVAHGWPSFAFAGTFGRVRLTDGLKWFFTDRFTSLMLPYSGPGWFRTLALIIYVSIASGALILLFGAYRSRRRALFFSLLGILIFTILFSVLYASSHFAAVATPRYFLPMVAPLAVLLGVVSAHLRKWGAPIAIACLPAFFLVVLQWPVLSWAASFEKDQAKQMEGIEALGDALEREGLDIIYSANTARSWNFALEERFVFVDYMNDFYRPHAQRAEIGPQPAVLNNYGTLDAFLRTTGGGADILRAAGHSVHHAFRPPELHRRPLPADAILRITDPLDNDITALLTDGRLDTEWITPLRRGEGWIEITFTKPTRICGFRMLSSHDRGYPRIWTLEIKQSESDWQPLFENEPFTYFFWSGPRWYWGSPFFRFETHTEPVTVTGIRITDASIQPTWRWTITQLQILTPDDPVLSEQTFVPELMEHLRQRNIQRLYCDRWLAHQIHQASNGTISTPRAPDVFPDTQIAPQELVILDRDTAVVSLKSEAPAIRDRLRDRRLPMTETTIGPWILFSFEGEQWRDIYTHTPGLFWQGWGLLLNETYWAEALIKRAETLLLEDPNDEEIVTMLREALRMHPLRYEVLDILRQVYVMRGEEDTSAQYKKAFIHATEPERKAPMQFQNGVEFLGYSIEEKTVTRGQTVQIRYFWHIPPDIDPYFYAVFVHFRKDGVLFQDDHVLLDDIPRAWIRSPSRLGIFRKDRAIHVPEHITPGPVEIVLGLYDRRTERRLKKATELPTRRNASVLPTLLTIE